VVNVAEVVMFREEFSFLRFPQRTQKVVQKTHPDLRIEKFLAFITTCATCATF
jgi:hypothetical protein